MAELIQLRQRIKAIETIKKITHAMRLIAMSSHSRLKNKQEPFTVYINNLKILFGRIQQAAPHWINPIMHPDVQENTRSLVILIGSQKGLCGNFNTTLFHQFVKNTAQRTDVIVIGKKAIDFISTRHYGPIIAVYEKCSLQNLFAIAQSIMQEITQAQPIYTSVILHSNILQNFFTQKPHMTKIIPFVMPSSEENNTQVQEYLWEQSATTILDSLLQQYLETEIQYCLFQSLLAEQAARFISMDSSTRNAESLLDVSKLEYNKLRQAKITKELTELVSSFQ
jgi:F-type H+-transporting ATPase subunit gamma